MAKREWLVQMEEGGSEQAERYGVALGLMAGGEITRLLTELVVLLHRQGGQAYIAAVRSEVDQDGFPVDEGEHGEWVTHGYHVTYENRDMRLVVLDPPPTELAVPPEVEDDEEPEQE